MSMTPEELNELACWGCHKPWWEAAPPSLLNGRWYCKVCFDSESDQIQKATDEMGMIQHLCDLIAGANDSESSTAVDPDGLDVDDPESPVNAFTALQERVKVLEEALRIVARWELPSRTYEWDFGTNGSRDYMKSIARAALEGK